MVVAKRERSRFVTEALAPLYIVSRGRFAAHWAGAGASTLDLAPAVGASTRTRARRRSDLGIYKLCRRYPWEGMPLYARHAPRLGARLSRYPIWSCVLHMA